MLLNCAIKIKFNKGLLSISFLLWLSKCIQRERRCTDIQWLLEILHSSITDASFLFYQNSFIRFEGKGLQWSTQIKFFALITLTLLHTRRNTMHKISIQRHRWLPVTLLHFHTWPALRINPVNCLCIIFFFTISFWFEHVWMECSNITVFQFIVQSGRWAAVLELQWGEEVWVWS